MAEQEQDRGVFRRVASHLWNRGKAIVPEIWQTLTDKVIPHGASEVAHALHTGSPYVPYGAAQSPLEVSQGESTAHGKTPEPSFDQKLEQYRGRGYEPDQDRGIDR